MPCQCKWPLAHRWGYPYAADSIALLFPNSPPTQKIKRLRCLVFFLCLATSVFPKFNNIAMGAPCAGRHRALVAATVPAVLPAGLVQISNVGWAPWARCLGCSRPAQGRCSAEAFAQGESASARARSDDNRSLMDLFNYGTFESALVYTQRKSGRKKLITCGSVHLITYDPGLAISLLYSIFVFFS